MATVTLGNIKLNWKGAYNAGTAYAIDDVVSYNGSSYIAKTATTGNLPTVTANWDIMSSAGTNGTNGTDLTSTLTTQGDILYRDGSGLQRLAKGTANQELRINSGATAPEWFTPAVATSDFVKINSASFANASSITIDGTTNWGATGTYRKHILGLDFKVVGGATAKLRVRSVKSGSIETGNNYSWGNERIVSTGGRSDNFAEGNDYMQIDGDYWRGDSNSNHSFDAHLHKLQGANNNDYLQMTGLTAHVNQDGDQRLHGTRFHGMTHSNHAMNNGRTGINIHTYSNNITGTYTTYGIK